MRKGMVIETSTAEEEAAHLARQKRNTLIFGIVLLVIVALLMAGTMWGLIRLGVMPFDNSDLFRSV
jgi:hypothetical protein